VLGLLNRVRKDIEVNRYLYIMLIHIINVLEFDWSEEGVDLVVEFWAISPVQI
jgi:hypothetical protein